MWEENKGVIRADFTGFWLEEALSAQGDLIPTPHPDKAS